MTDWNNDGKSVFIRVICDLIELHAMAMKKFLLRTARRGMITDRTNVYWLALVEVTFDTSWNIVLWEAGTRDERVQLASYNPY